MGTVHVLEAVRHVSSVRVVLVVTSDKCYENRGFDRGYREDDPMGGYDPYSSSKGCAELVTSAYRRSFFENNARGAAIASCRAGNVIGGGDWGRDRLLPDLMNAFADGRPAAIRNPLATRPWQHVLEPLHGYLHLAERLYEGNPDLRRGWNFGPAQTDVRSVAWIADRAAHLWGDGARWQQDPAVHPHEAQSLQLDISRAEQQLHWTPLLSVDAAVEWTVRWRKGLEARQPALDLTMADIGRYAALAAAASR
jgi:CDP-glucose 4,6-dehydratase